MKKRVYKYILLIIFLFIFCIDNIEAKKISEVNVGDWIKMTPNTISYTISKDLTGYDSDQTINPSELNLWRVIRKNADGTVDVVSEYVSSKAIYFQGSVGYTNFIGALNTIAAQYVNKDYVLKVRHMGYKDQTEICTDISSSACPTDTGYQEDMDLVSKNLNTLVGKDPSGKVLPYFLASRYIESSSTRIEYKTRIITTSGTTLENTLFFSTDMEGIDSAAIRPIITLKKEIELPIPNSDGVYELIDEKKNPEDSSFPENPVEDSSNFGQGEGNISDEQNNNVSQNQQNSSKNEIENPDTGGFVICIFIFLVIALITIILNLSNKRKIFKL